MPQIDNPQRSLLAPLAPQANRVLGFIGVLVALLTVGVALYQIRAAGSEQELLVSVDSAEAFIETVEEPWGNSTRTREQHKVRLKVSGINGSDTPGVEFAPVIIEGFRSSEAAEQYALESIDEEILVYVIVRDGEPRLSAESQANALAYWTLIGGVFVLLYALLLLFTNRTLQQHAGVE